MKTKLIEFRNKEKDIPRGILSIPDIFPNKAILMCGGFERSTTTEKKFKVLADELNKKGIASFRFDYAGCGLSDGSFSEITVKKMVSELKKALQKLKQKTKCEKISIVGHSLSACAIAKLINKNYFEKIILLAPALNQKELLRYWFTVSAMKKVNPPVEVSWKNYKENLNEEEFQKDIEKFEKTTKENMIRNFYFQENKNKDYSNLISNTANILLIHGNKDDKVPKESIIKDFNHKIIVENGDHDLEKPDMMKQWIIPAITFLH